MALICGTNSKFPCPICLVPDTQMSDGSTHPLWTSESMQNVYNEAMAMVLRFRPFLRRLTTKSQRAELP